ncbi:MAG: tRNA uridine-5-carboxymethylaminomethyl(34) synthesis GTPase MnmE [Parvibaculales bacterium]
MDHDSTIFALSTPRGRGGVAVIRMSGMKTQQAIELITKKPAPAARLASVRGVYNPASGDLVDEALVLFFSGPNSYTGEDVAELHLHGGLAVIDEVLEVLGEQAGLTPAGPGDFTRRAVINGRLDLTRAEAVADLIDAETRAQKNQALRQMRGALGTLYQGWRRRLSQALAHLEADIEFADEDLPGGIGQAVLADVAALTTEIEEHLAERRGRSLREGVEIALIGAPNVGKSSLLNVMAGREAAIVSARAGTTRDVIEVSLEIAGVPVVMADTAGLREAGDEIEREGVRRAKKRASEADLKLFVLAADQDTDTIEDSGIDVAGDDFVIVNKTDLADPAMRNRDVEEFAPNVPATAIWPVSAKTGAGMEAFLDALEQTVARLFGLTDHPALTRKRHKLALEAALVGLHRALSVAGDEAGLELVAEDMRLAMREIGRITGEVDVEALLDIVFSDFCIGK